jgi:hydrogenase expression/formation protein HypC
MCLAVPGKIISTEGEGDFRVARVEFGGVAREASLAYVPEARCGDYVLVHVGFAIAVVDEQAAAETLAVLEQLGAEFREPS